VVLRAGGADRFDGSARPLASWAERPAGRLGPTPVTRRLVLVAAVAVSLASVLAECGAALAGAPSSARLATLSSNWAGYAVTGTSRSPVRFKSVSAHWVQPSVICAGGRSYSGFWVGLGGYHQSSRALEQTGTEADCGGSGNPSYFAWYELVPKGPVELGLKVRPGDSITASVTVVGQRARFSLRDLTTSRAYSKAVRASVTDVSSAEWIAEAPSVCGSQNSCHVLPLANFGTVQFSNSSATSTSGHAGPIGNSAWSLTALELLDLGGGFGHGRFRSSPPVTTATPTSLTSSGSAFTVAWRQAPLPARTPAPIGPPGGYPGG
jgi:hypothetical protein